MFGIPGLLYIPQYLSAPHHDFLLTTIDTHPWRSDLARRTQHYGYVYDYRAKTVTPDAFLGPLPTWLHRIATHLHADGVVRAVPDQAIINDYQPGQGIADHVDCVPCFDDVVISLSLGGAVVMDLKHRDQHVPILLESRSVLVLRGDARYIWTHGIAKRQTDSYHDQRISRQRRVSITFRQVIVAHADAIHPQR